MESHKNIMGHGGEPSSTKDDDWDYHNHMLCPECANYMKNGVFGCSLATELLAFNLKNKTSAAIFECSQYKEKSE